MQVLIHRMNLTAHISLQIFAISKSVETKLTVMRPNFLARPRLDYLWCCLRLVASAFPLPPVWRPAVRLRRVGEGVFTVWVRGPQGVFS